MQQRSLKLIQSVLVSLILVTFLTSCSGVKKLQIFKTEVERQHLNLDNTPAPKLEELNWLIITSENADEVMAKLEKDNIDPVLFGLTDEEYEKLAKNFAQIRAYIMKQNQILNTYREYYEEEKKEEKK